MEWIEIVDEYNRVIGCGTREFVHTRNLCHRASHLLLFNNKNELLLQQRAQTKSLFPGMWDSSAAGHVEIGESYWQCAMRECQEELGLIPDSINLLGTLPAAPQNGWEFVQVFKGFTDKSLIDYSIEEVSAVRWCSLSELENLLKKQSATFSPSFLEIATLLMPKS
jgi:isopentenyl-diphosphate delta-isomerase type 1